MAATLPLIQADMIRGKDLKRRLDFAQGAYNVGVAASARTHWGGGVADTLQCNWSTFGHYWKKYGVIDFERFPPLFAHHGHLVWVGCPHQHPQADAQEKGAVKSGWNGLAGAASRYGEWFRVPDLTWQQAVKKYKPAPPPPPVEKGILGMTVPLYYHWGPAGGTPLPKGKVVWPVLNDKGGISVIGKPTALCTLTATVGVTGLAAGESVAATFELVYDYAADGKPTVSISARRPKVLTASNNVRTIHFTGRVPKSDKTGATVKLRVRLQANANAAKLAFIQIDGMASE